MFVRMDGVNALTGLDAEGVLAEAERVHADMVAAEAARFALAAHWADLHSGEALAEERRRTGARPRPGMERAKRAGAHGTPLVAEFAAMELGAQFGMGYAAAACFLRDAVNVRHRHPLLWQEVAGQRARVWQARAVARLCAEAGLDLDQARAVDAATTPYLAALPWSRFEELVRGRIVEADPEAAEARAEAAALARFVRTGQSTEHGLKILVARATAGDVIFFVAMVDRIATVLLERGDTDPVDVRRSKAIGILANPARALVLLEESAAAAAEAGGRCSADDEGDDLPEDGADAGGADAGDATDAGDAADDGDNGEGEPAETGGAEPRTPRCPTCRGERAVAGDPIPFVKPARGLDLRRGALDVLGRVDPKKLLPPAVLYIHASEDTIRTGHGVARMEGVGAITATQVQDFLRGCLVRPVRVLDVAGQRPVDGYEVPAETDEALFLRNPACVSPWGTNMSRAKDTDHTEPYVPRARGGPPGQTHLGNLGLLARFPHRVKTHGRWSLRQPAPGVFLWRSPHGYWFRVDHSGTHALGKEPRSGPAVSPVDHARGRPEEGSVPFVDEVWVSPLEVDLAELVLLHGA